MRATHFRATKWADPRYERACLLPFFVRDGEPYYCFFAAPGSLRLSVVGGIYEPDKDSDLLDTLARESREELGREFMERVRIHQGYSFDLNLTLCLAAPVADQGVLRAEPNDELLCVVWMPLAQLTSILRYKRIKVSHDLKSLAGILGRISLDPDRTPVPRVLLVPAPPVYGGDASDAMKVLATCRARYRLFVSMRHGLACLGTCDGSYFFLTERQLGDAVRAVRRYGTGLYVNSPEALEWAKGRADTVTLSPVPETYSLTLAVSEMRKHEAKQYAERPARKNARRRDQNVVLAIVAQNERLLYGDDAAQQPDAKYIAAAVAAGAYVLVDGAPQFP